MISLPAWARAKGMTSVAANSPRTPWAQAAFAELGHGVGAGPAAPHHEGDGVPAVVCPDSGRGVVSGYDEDVRAEVDDFLEGGVDFLQGADFGLEVAVFACGVGALVVDEEEVVVVVVGDHLVDYIGEPRTRGHYLHAEEPSDAAVHRIGGDAERVELVDVGHGGHVGELGEAPEGEHVGGAARVFQDIFDFLDGGIDDVGGRLGVGVGGADGRGNDAVDLFIGVGEVFAEARATEDDDESVGLDGVDIDPCAVDLDIIQETAELSGLAGGEASGAAVGDYALGVDGAEVAAHGEVVGGEVYADTGGFKDSALDEVGYRVVAEEGQVAGAAAGDDSGGHGYGEPAHGEGGETIKVGG